MRKFVALLGVFLCLVGVKLHYGGLNYCGFKGQYAEYHKGSETIYASSIPMVLGGYAQRLDFSGGAVDAYTALRNMNARILWSEDFTEGLTVVYAYSPHVLSHEMVCGKKVNVMVAYYASGGKVSVGTPLLAGSY